MEAANGDSLGQRGQIATIKMDGLNKSNGGGGGSSSKGNRQVGATAKRYIILLLFCLNNFNMSYQWIHVSASTTKATRLYQVETYMINFASIVFLLAFLASWPACFLIERIGIRRAIVWGSFLSLLGSAVKCSSVPPVYTEQGNEGPGTDTHGQSNGYVYLMLLGQCLLAISEQMIFSLPSRLASLWFPDHQVSLATSICILGNQMGIAVGFMVPTHVFLAGAETRQEIGQGFSAMFWATTLFSTVIFLFSWTLFDEAPVRPPGEARRKQIETERAPALGDSLNSDSHQLKSTASEVRHLLGQIVALCKNRDLILVAICYGITLSRGDAISTVLEQTMSTLYSPEVAESSGGITGFIIITSGALGLPIWGRILDKTRAYKLLNIILAILTSLTLVLMAYVLIYLKWITGLYLSTLIFGFFQMGSLVACMDFAIELTYPAPELITSTFLNTMVCIFGSSFVAIGSYLVDAYSVLAAHIFYMATIVGGFVCISCTRERLKRQEAIAKCTISHSP